MFLFARPHHGCVLSIFSNKENKNKFSKMKIFLSIILTTASIFIGCGESKVNNVFTDKDLAELEKRQNIAAFLAEYDYWVGETTDTLLKNDTIRIRKQLGQECFGYKSNGQWVFNYGKYEDNEYKSAIRYEVHGDSSVTIKETGNDSLEQMFGYMYHAVIGDAKRTMDSVRIGFNSYLYVDSITNTKQVWFIPEVLDGWEIGSGCEMNYVFNSTGDSLLSVNKYFDNVWFAKANKDHKILLESVTQDIPKVNQLFFVLRWGNEFKDVVIKTTKGARKLEKSNGNKSWVNVDSFY